MKNYLNFLEKISENIGKSVSYLLLLMVFITVGVVVARYLFQTGSVVMQDSITYLHASVVILAMGYSLQTNSHVRVDIFYQKMNEKQKAIVNLLGSFFFLLPFSIFTLWVSFPYVRRSWAMGEKSAEAGGIPAVFLLKSLLLALVFVLVLQAIIEISKNTLVLLNKEKNTNTSPSSHKSKKIQGEGL